MLRKLLLLRRTYSRSTDRLIVHICCQTTDNSASTQLKAAEMQIIIEHKQENTFLCFPRNSVAPIEHYICSSPNEI